MIIYPMAIEKGVDWSLKRISRNVHRVTWDLTKKSDCGWILIRSDAHHDSKHCDRAMEKRHLELAVKRNAMILDNGDLYDAMQGKFDRRSSKEDLLPEYKNGDYLDSLVNEAVKYYAPYAKQFAVLGQGNHETAIQKHHETNLTDRLRVGLNRHLKDEGVDHRVYMGGYGGWIRLVGISHGAQDGKWLHYFHGSGGGGPVTRGVIQTNREAVYHPDPTFCVTGHTHDQWIVPIARDRIKDTGTLYQDTQYHIKIAGYKEEYGDGYGGWHIERGAPPKPVGACWIKLMWLGSSHDKTKRGIGAEVFLTDR
jgi:hypothetical protein